MVDVKPVKISTHIRAAITVIEVLFAMLVAVVGLLGIASVLPLAARNAKESSGYNFVHTAGSSWYQEFATRGMNDYGGWRALRDFDVGGAVHGFTPMQKDPLVAFSPPAPISFDVTGFSATGTAPYSATPTHSTLTSGSVHRVWVNQSICIDPYFYTDPVISQDVASAIGRPLPFEANRKAYRPAVFPYYQDGHNPVTDPMGPSAAWPDQPRMLRVTLDAPMSGLPPSLRQVNREFAQMIFTSNDDFSAFVDEKQNEIPAVRLFTSTGTTVPSFSKAISDRKYSWLATLSPRDTTSLTAVQKEYTLSLAIFNGRDLSWVDPGDVEPGSVENKPGGERLTWVVPLSGAFIGGNGGRVRLISAGSSDDRLTIGDWIMLARHEWLTAAPLNRASVFGWYRIVAMDAESRRGPLSVVNAPMPGDPYDAAGTADVWARDVVLEGPDWQFASGSIAVNFGPTTGTLMKNVITVIDRSTIIP